MSDPSAAATIVSVAQTLGVDPRLALADAYQESKLDPRAVGDSGTSFGLFQLHEGGELDNIPVPPGTQDPFSYRRQAAFDPATNSQIALSQFAGVARANPNADPGRIAALAERPADPQGYAAAVDSLYFNPPAALAAVYANPSTPIATLTKSGGGGPSVGGFISGATGGISDLLPGAAGAAKNLNPLGGLASGAEGVVLKGLFVLAALGLVVAGLYTFAKPKAEQAAQTVGPIAAAAAM